MPATVAELRMMSCYIHPLGDRVLIIPTETPDEVSGLILPANAKDPYPPEGEVVECGPDVPLVPTIGKDGLPEKDEHDQDVMQTVVKPGDRVVYSRYAGSQLKFGDGGSFLILPSSDILGLLDPKCPSLVGKKKATFSPQ